MQTFKYKLTFHTPAFLGNAEQAAQWRTPPIKALLRQWWRVVYAAEQRYSVEVVAMRHAEGRLFGHAWLEDDRDERGNKVAARRSEVRLRLDKWEVGKLKTWDGLDQDRVPHPEVKNHDGMVVPVGAHLYLGYGPLVFKQGKGTALKSSAAIQATDSARLSLAMPEDADGRRLLRALALMDLYGTLGGRSRNGWGSFDLTPADGTAALARTLGADCMLPWRDALASDWPQAIGSDGAKPLIWQTAALPDWKHVMRRLAEIKIALRTQFVFTTGRDASRPEDRHWLSYPVTNHSVRDWGNNARLPNSLRFKVRAAADGTSLHGVVFHMPCLPPPAFKPDRRMIEQVWQRVHAHLDADKSLTRIAA